MGTKNYRRDTLIEAAILFSLFYLPAFLMQQGLFDPDAFNSLAYNIQLWLLMTPQTLLTLYTMYRDERLNFSSFGLIRFPGKHIPFFILALAATILLVVLIQILFQFALPIDDNAPSWKLDNYFMVFPVLISSLLTGYSEEIFFRSYLFTRLEILQPRQIQRIIAVNALFAMGHLYEGLAGGINAFILGCFFSLLFIKKRNIHVPAIIHGLYNFTALMLSLLL